MERHTDHAFVIDIATRYLDEQSEPAQGRFVFAYTIQIRNSG
jgi:ApaG protein